MCLLTETRALSAQGEKRALVGNLTMPRQALGMPVAIAWLPGPAGTRRRVAKLSVEEPDAAGAADKAAIQLVQVQPCQLPKSDT